MRILIALLFCAMPACAQDYEYPLRIRRPLTGLYVAPKFTPRYNPPIPLLVVVDNGAQPLSVRERWIDYKDCTPDSAVCTPSRQALFLEQAKKRWINYVP